MKRLFVTFFIAAFCIILFPVTAGAETKSINTVTGSAITVGTINGISISQTSAELYKGKLLNLKITGTSGYVKWKSDNAKVAVVSKKGKVTAIDTGTANITATINTGYDKISLTCKVTVKSRLYSSEINVILEEDDYKDIIVSCDNLKSNESIFYGVEDEDIASADGISENAIRIIAQSEGVTSLYVYIGKDEKNINKNDKLKINIYVVNDKEWIPSDYIKDLIGPDFYLYTDYDYDSYTMDYKGHEISFIDDDYDATTYYNVDDLKEAGIL